ncbi:MAG: beta-galactosidase [Fimbriimonadales bacterium]
MPAEYWRHRIQMAKAMGLNTVAAYIFWNYHETSEGKFDFSTTNHNIAQFFRICQEEGMWAIVRPGPYCCAEWDFGGIPPYLLKYPDLKVRCMDTRYIGAAERYLSKLADVLRPLQVSNGGPILLLQIENEYGSYGNDRTYMEWIRSFWRKKGFTLPFFTGDEHTYMLEAGSLPGCAVGLDSGSELAHWDLARKMNPGVPVFSSETYPGWLTHWGENWAETSTESIVGEVKFLLDNKKSFNLYMVHGGTNFGFTAGANSGGKGYEPDLTSYDYDAPITEQGRATPKFMALRELIGKGRTLPEVPAPIPARPIPPIAMTPFTSLGDHLPKAVAMKIQPKPFEAIGLDSGMMLSHPVDRPQEGAACHPRPPRLRHGVRRWAVRGNLGPARGQDGTGSAGVPIQNSRPRHPRGRDGTDQLRPRDHRPEGDHRPGDPELHDPDGLAGLSPAARREVDSIAIGNPGGGVRPLLPRPLRA